MGKRDSNGAGTRTRPKAPGYQIPEHIRRMGVPTREELDDIEEILEYGQQGHNIPLKGQSALAQRTGSVTSNSRYGQQSRFSSPPRPPRNREFAQIVNIFTFYEGATAILPTREYVDVESNEIYTWAEVEQIPNKAIVAYYLDGEFISGKHEDFAAIKQRVGNDVVQLTQAVREFFEEDNKKKSHKEVVDTSYIRFKNKANQMFISFLIIIVIQFALFLFSMWF